jgi:hypothetical protein
MQALIALTDTDKMQANGLPFPTEDSARWCFRHADERGLAAAFIRIGRRVYVDPQKFHELVRQHAA